MGTVRGRLRALLVLEAAARLIAGFLWVAVALAILDWIVHFPMWVRAVFLLVGAAAAGLLALRRIIGPLRVPIRLDELALRLRRLTPLQRDLFASAIEFAVGQTAGTSAGMTDATALWSRVIGDADRTAHGLRPSGVLNHRPAARAAALATVSMAVAAGFFVLTPEHARTGLRRLVTPFHPSAWPRRVVIGPMARDAVAAFDEPFTVEVAIERGDRPRLHAYVYHQEGAGPVRRDLMQRRADGAFCFTWERIRRPVRYWFSAGDDDTRDRPGLIRVAHRPRVEAARLTLTPPAYAAHLRNETVILGTDEVSVLRGSRVKLEVRSSAPAADAADDDGGGCAVVFSDSRRFALRPGAEDGRTLSAEFDADADGAFQIRLVDRNGLASTGEAAHRLRVLVDRPPVVSVLRPPVEAEATPQGAIELAYAAHDDVGLAGLRLLAAPDGEALAPVMDLIAGSFNKESSHAVEPRRRIEGVNVWSLSGFGAGPGDVIVYALEAADGFVLGGRTHAPVRSAEHRILIVSPEQMARRIAANLISTQGRLRELDVELAAIRAETEELLDRDEGGDDPPDSRRARLDELLDRLRQLLKTNQTVADALRAMSDEAVRNNVDHLDAALQAMQIERRLRGAVAASVRRAAEQLKRAGRAAGSDRQREHLADSARHQQDAAELLQGMIDELNHWSVFEEFVEAVRELLDRQETLERATAHLARIAPAGLPNPDDDPVRAERGRLSARQKQAQIDAGAIVSRMEEFAERPGAGDRAARACLREAVRTAVGEGTLESMNRAADALAAARYDNAVDHQRKAASGLRAMLAALATRVDHALAELSRELEDILGRLDRLIDAQNDLIARARSAASAAADEETAILIADRQSSLAITSRRLARRLPPRDESTVSARREIDDAGKRMDEAADALLEGDATTTDEHQSSALAALTRAREHLQAWEQRIDEMRAERSLDQIVQELRELHRRQSDLHGETTTIAARADTDGRVARVDALRLNRLSESQRGLLDPLSGVRQRLGRSAVYEFVCDRAAEAMNAAADAMADHRPAGAAPSQREVLRDLQRLIEAADVRPPRGQARFVNDGGGGGAASPTVTKPIPTLAELRVLRLMQTDINEATTDLDSQLPEPLRRSEADLRRIEALGRRQAELRTLALKMIEGRAGEPVDKSEED